MLLDSSPPDHPIVGTWLVLAYDPDAGDSLVYSTFTFTADGTVLNFGPPVLPVLRDPGATDSVFLSAGSGAWTRGDDGVHVRFVHWSADKTGQILGRRTVSAGSAIVVDATANRWDGKFKVEVDEGNTAIKEITVEAKAARISPERAELPPPQVPPEDIRPMGNKRPW